MTIAPVERPVASAAYSFVRFIGGGLAPYAAGRLVVALNIHVPFFIAAGAVAAGIVILTTVRSELGEAERVQAEHVSTAVSAAAPPPERIVAVTAASAPYVAGTAPAVILAAVDDSPIASIVTEAAARLAGLGSRAVHVVHAREAAVASEVGVDGEDLDDARALVHRHLDQLAAHHVPAEGQILLHAADHGAAGRMVAEYAAAVGATTIVIGAPTHGGLAELMDASTSRELLRMASSHIVIINPAAPISAAVPLPSEPEAAAS